MVQPAEVDYRLQRNESTTADARLQVIIAGAGGAAHLPGMIAALTPLPVIGVPVTPAGAHLDGLDALLSIVQMPRGVPVATVAIGNAANAGLLAARILASHDTALQLQMTLYQVSNLEDTPVMLSKPCLCHAAYWLPIGLNLCDTLGRPFD